jgi:3-hydroxy-9,10-secoandrosta-1,3,5(10)-triene-9,17-dione monooxygenase reductase component
VNVLAEDQEELCRAFAASGTDKFAGVGWAPGPFTGAPILTGALAWVECRLEQLFDGGDHAIAVGRVLDLQTHEGRPLLFYRGGFGRFEV